MSPRIFAALIVAAALPVQAEVYKWLDAKGQVNYSNAPPPSVKDTAQPVEERISIMGMDPAVRAAAERRFAAQERAEELDWQRRQQAMAVQARVTPPPPRRPTTGYAPRYAPTYYPAIAYRAVVYSAVAAPAPRVTHSRAAREHRHPHR
jgi:hypothetical protein